MNTQDVRKENATKRVLDKLAVKPMQAKEFTEVERQQLRPLEKTGVIVCSDQNDFWWEVKK